MKFLAIGSEQRGSVGSSPTMDGSNCWFLDVFTAELQFNQNREVMGGFRYTTPSNYFGGKIESPGSITLPMDEESGVVFLGATLGLLTQTLTVDGYEEVSIIYAVPIEENYYALTGGHHYDKFPSETVWINSEVFLRKIAGMAVNQLTITAEQGSALVMMTADMVGGKETLESVNTTITEGDMDLNNYYAFSQGSIKVAKGGGSLASFNTITSFSLTINRNLKTDPLLNNSRYVNYWAMGELEVTGSVTAIIDEESAKLLYMYFDPSTDTLPVSPEQYSESNRFIAIELVFDTAEAIPNAGNHTKGMFIYIPQAVIESASKTETERGQTTVSIDFRGLAWYNDNSYSSPTIGEAGDVVARDIVGHYLPLLIGFKRDSNDGVIEGNKYPGAL